jgi:hypothetical protein
MAASRPSASSNIGTKSVSSSKSSKKSSGRPLLSTADPHTSSLLSARSDDAVPTLTPSKSELSLADHTGYAASFNALVYGSKGDSAVARAAINGLMTRIAVRFLGLRLPLTFGAVLLYFCATIWLD